MNTTFDTKFDLDFEKSNGLVPVIVQHFLNREVLMLGYMNQEALEKTQAEGKVTFFSRTKNRLWTKGESSNNFLIVKDIKMDCDIRIENSVKAVRGQREEVSPQKESSKF